MRPGFLCTAIVIAAAAVLAGLPPGGAAAAHAAAIGTIRGRIDIRASGTSVTVHRPDVGALGSGPNSTHDVPERHPSVVYLEGGPRGAFESYEEPHARLDQRNETFVPHVLAITVGTTVDFPNDDRTYHSVFSLSKPKPFDLGRYASGKVRSVKFDRPGIIRVFCDIHSHMSAFILVFAHRFFAVTDDDGRYHLDAVPPGTYNLTVWNEALRGDPPKRPVTVPDAGGDVDGDFTVR